MANDKIYSIKKSRQIMEAGYEWYKKKRDTLSNSDYSVFENDLEQLDQAILANDQAKASEYAHKVETFSNAHFKKSVFSYAWELIVALVLALVIATFVRQMWFEPYEIPTGSMRPTFKEQDHLTVSKLAFGINTPLATNHLYFDPKLLQRGGIFIFSGANLPFIDQVTTYFGIIPYTKRYIKRDMGFPGDTVYFYGGKIYALDRDGNPLKEFLDSPYLKGLEHVPFLSFEGHATMPSQNQVLFNQMFMPVGKLKVTSAGVEGEVYNGKGWVKDDPEAQKKSHDTIQTYSDLWGIKNYAMARLLTKKQVEQNPLIDSKELKDAVLYLELRHNPSLTYSGSSLASNERGAGNLIIPYTTIIPLQQKHLDAIMDNLYTARFVVKNGRAARYNVEGTRFDSNSVALPNVPDGTYEFYFGKAEKIGWGGVPSAVESNNPLYSHDPSNVQRLFNLGIEVNTAVAPKGYPQRYYPQRYAYFRDGDLYLLGAPVIKKDDPTLVDFVKSEKEKEAKSTTANPYIGFKDYGPPVKADGSYNVEFLKTFGLKIPEGRYMALGDNHAMSSDSRVFGFIPEANIQGAPSLILWPPGPRWGEPQQKPYQIVNIPRLIVWGLVGLGTLIWYLLHRRKLKQPIFKKLDKY